jgi:hypothetical protein
MITKIIIDSVQSPSFRELVATAGAAHADGKVVADQLAAAVGENRRTIDPARALLGFC